MRLADRFASNRLLKSVHPPRSTLEFLAIKILMLKYGWWKFFLTLLPPPPGLTLLPPISRVNPRFFPLIFFLTKISFWPIFYFYQKRFKMKKKYTKNYVLAENLSGWSLSTLVLFYSLSEVPRHIESSSYVINKCLKLG